MAQDDLHNDDIEKHLGEIRKHGEPYNSEEPAPLYWANFRVRVMQQIEAKEARNGCIGLNKPPMFMEENRRAM